MVYPETLIVSFAVERLVLGAGGQCEAARRNYPFFDRELKAKTEMSAYGLCTKLRMRSYLRLHTSKASPNSHRLPALVRNCILARFAESLVQPETAHLLLTVRRVNTSSLPSLEFLYPDHHVQVTLRVLFNHIPDVVRLSGLLELPPCHEILDLSDGSYCVLVRLRQSSTEKHDVLEESTRRTGTVLA